MNFVATFWKNLKKDENKIHIGKTVITVIGIIALDLVLIACTSLIASPAPILAVTLSWVWFLLPGMLLSFALADDISWWERIPVSFVLTIGLATPITIFAILMRLDLDRFTLLHTSLLLICAVIWLIHRQKVRVTQENVSSLIQNQSLRGTKETLIPLLFVLIIVIGILMILAYEWPLFGDEVAGLAQFAEVIQHNQITGIEPFHGTDVPVTPRNELTGWTYMAILADKISGTSPPDFFINTRPILVLVATLSLAAFLNQFLKNKYQTLFFVCLWGIYLLATSQADGTGNDLITRIVQDKFAGWFVVIPVVLIFMLRFVENRSWSNLIGFGIVTFGGSMVHPITLTQAIILIGGFGVIYFLVDRSRRTFVNLLIVALVLLLSTVIPFLQYIRYNNYSPVVPAGLGDAVEFGRLSSAVGRYRLWMLGGGSFILHPSIIFNPVIIVAYILLPIIIFKIRKNYAACLIVGTLLILPVLLYTPTFAAMAGQVVTPYLIWRLAWPYPLFAVLTIGWVLWLLVQKLGGWLKVNGTQLLIYNFGYLILIALTLFSAAPSIRKGLEDYSVRSAELKLSTCETAKNALLYMNEISAKKSVNVLASHNLNFCIPGYAALANVVEFRGYGTVNRLSEDHLAESIQRVEDVNYFNVAEYYDDLIMEAVVRHKVDYILIEKEKLELDLQFKYLPAYFQSVFEDSTYSLYQVRKPVKSSKIVEANTALRLRQFGIAMQIFDQILMEEPTNLLAHLGVGLAQEGLGENELAITSYQQAISYAPNEPALRAQLAGAYVLKKDFEKAIKEYKVATNLSPERYSLHASLGQVYILAGQNEEARASFERVASLRAIKDTAEYYSVLGRSYQSVNLISEASRYFEKAISLDPETKRYTDLARALANSGKADEAIEIYQMAVALDPWNYLPHLDLGYLYGKQGRIDEAIKELEIAWQLKPTNVSAYILLGQAIQKKSGLEAAVKRLEELKQVSRVLPGPYRGIALLMVASGDFEDALQALNISENIQPKSVAILTAKGYILMANGEIGEAYEAFDQALLYNPDLISTRIGLSLLYTSESRFDLEIGQLLQVVRLAPTVAWSHLNLAQAYKSQGKWKLAQEQIEWAIMMEPENVESYIARGDLNRAQSNFDLAVSDYSKALEIDPDNIKALIGLGNVYQDLANYAEAERIYQFAVDADKNSAYAKLKLAEVFWLQGRFEEATTLEEAAAEIAPDSDIVMVKLADTYKIQGKIEEAKALYERVVQIEPGIVSAYTALAQLIAEEDSDQNSLLSLYNSLIDANPRSAEAYLVAGQFFSEQGQFDLAEQIFKTALTFPDVSIENYLSLSKMQQQRGEWETAMATLQAASAVFSGKAVIFNNLADFYLRTGDIGQAEVYFNKAIELDPSSISAYVGKSKVEQIKGNFGKAEQVLQTSIAYNPGSAQAYLTMASFQESMGRYDQAEENLTDALAIMPADIHIRQEMGLFYMRQNRYDEALHVFQKALELPGSKLEIYLSIGDLRFAEMQYEEAIGWYKAASLVNRSDVKSYLAMAKLYQATEKWDRARETLTTALYMEPMNVEANLAMGELNLRLDRPDDARVFFEKASTFDRSQISPLIALAQNSSQSGDLTQAISYLEQAIETSPTSLLPYAALAQVYQQLEDRTQAEAILSRGIQKTIDKQAAYLARAVFYENQGSWHLAQADYENAWDFAPYAKSAGLKLVDFLFRQNQIDSALTTLNKLETLIGTDSDIGIMYGNIYSFQTQWNKAIEAYQQAIAIGASTNDAYLGLARVYELQGDMDSATNLLRTGVSNVPSDPDLLLGLGNALQAQGRFAEAQDAFQNALRLDPLNLSSSLDLEQLTKALQAPELDVLTYVQSALASPSVEAFRTIAQLYQYRGEWNLAKSWYLRAVNLEPYGSENWLQLGNYYRALYQWNEALEAYDNALKYKPASMEVYLARGFVQEELGLLEDAISSYRRAIEINPINIEGYIALSKLNFKAGDIEQSLAIIKDGIARVPGDYRGYQTLGDIYISIGPENYLQAEEAYLQGLGVLPGAVELYVRMADLYTEHVLAAREKLDAAQALENLAQYRLEMLLDSNKTSGVRRRTGTMELTIDEATQLYDRYKKGLAATQHEFDLMDLDFEKAMANYVHALKLDANNELSLLGIGKLQLAKGSTDEALRYFDMASATNPHSILALSYLGNICLELGQPHAAIEAFEMILVYEPGNLLAQMGLVEAYNDLPSWSISQATASVEQSLFKLPTLIEHLREVETRVRNISVNPH